MGADILVEAMPDVVYKVEVAEVARRFLRKEAAARALHHFRSSTIAPCILQHPHPSLWRLSRPRYGSSARVCDACDRFLVPMAHRDGFSRPPQLRVKSCRPNLRLLRRLRLQSPRQVLRRRVLPKRPRSTCRNGEPLTPRWWRTRSRNADYFDESMSSLLDPAVAVLLFDARRYNKPLKCRSNSFRMNASRRRESSC